MTPHPYLQRSYFFSIFGDPGTRAKWETFLFWPIVYLLSCSFNSMHCNITLAQKRIGKSEELRVGVAESTSEVQKWVVEKSAERRKVFTSLFKQSTLALLNFFNPLQLAQLFWSWSKSRERMNVWYLRKALNWVHIYGKIGYLMYSTHGIANSA